MKVRKLETVADQVFDFLHMCGVSGPSLLVESTDSVM